jgi:predicted AlkP superfamily pyrophosphatase or phosphodiesterase
MSHARPTRQTRKVLHIVIDALASDVVVPAIESGRLPTLASLTAAGQLRHTTAIFPSITPAATASIVTGCYPCDHGISGAYWWDQETRSLAFFGSDLWMIYNKGPGEYFRDFMVTLNEKHLKADPIFQSVEKEGKLASVINFMWFRGDCQHDVNAPLLLELIAGSGIPDRVSGPTVLALGDFVAPYLPGADAPISVSGGLSKRYGFHDEVTAEYLNRMFAGDTKPDYTLAYFPNNDFDSHEQGPAKALAAVEAVDKALGDFFSTQGGIQQFLKDFAVVICGDHSQSVTHNAAADRDIVLEELLQNFEISPAGVPWKDTGEVLPCPNLRAAQIYLNSSLTAERQQQLVDRLLQEPKIDQVLLKRGADTKPNSDADVSFDVITADRGRLNFHRVSTAADALASDDYGNHWVWSGDLAAIDAVKETDRIVYGDYPNALERIASAFSNSSASLWVTAKLGHEFRTADTHTHPGGSHGSLHRLDSTSPFIVAGLPDGIQLPDSPRTIDIAPLCHSILGL